MSDKECSGSGHEKPTVLLVIGMAGSGKTSLIHRIQTHIEENEKEGYILNLDPAVLKVPYEPNVDIRDTVNYKNVMKQYNLGPNGGILTALNLFATRFDQVVALCEKPRDPPLQYVIADTPGQIEIFTWSASGAIISEAFASEFPTVIAYVVDTPRCSSPQTFIANMLQACSIIYKTRLPMVLVFNKIDVCHHSFATEWMKDFDAFASALDADPSFSASFSRSLSLVLEKFYENIPHVGVSAATGEGMSDLFKTVDRCKEEYKKEYLPYLEERKKARQYAEDAKKQSDLEKLQHDIKNASIFSE
ncbi:GPN-loop GTPase QQT2 [Picochlorum sp. SENEW3]|nr:GPN-loop GTPase QQT2 [Picochlorum sp. SENEW3]